MADGQPDLSAPDLDYQQAFASGVRFRSAIARDLGSSTAMPTPRHHDRDPQDPAHDILAAEEFGMPAPDPALHREPAHDVLAAEEFGMPASDPALHYGPVTLPADPTGIAEPHDVLAAEEFAMPVGRRHETLEAQVRRRRRRTAPAAAALVLLATFLLRRRRA
jgi:hypothetical protein